MNKKTLEEIEKRCHAATQGPWVSYIEGRDHDSADSFIMTGIAMGEDIWGKNRGEDIYILGATHADQDFIAHARQDIPALIKEVRRLQVLLGSTE